jgi:uncharacterized protein YndB with AHSA1/START domain
MPVQEYTTTVTVHAPVEKTFSVFMDTSRLREWMPGYRQIVNISGKENEPGSKWKIVFFENGQEIVMTETVTGFKPNELFTFNVQNEVMNSDNEIRFAVQDNSTVITAHAKYEGGNIFWKSLFVFFNSGMKKQSEQMYNDFKKIAEE